MSLILEALRKSEAERRRAQVPDLLAGTQVPAAPAPVAAQRWPWLVLGAGVLLGALWLWRALSPSQATPALSSGAEASVAAPAPELPEPQPSHAAAPPRKPLIIAPAKASPVAANPAAPLRARMDAPGESAPRVDLVAAPVPAAAPTPAAPAALTSPPPGAPAPAESTMLRVSDLGSEERGQLPPLKLSMHMWNDAPAQRFVIIDGNRLGVGARIGELTVADIVSDGVVLDWNGRLLKLPLR